MEENLQEYKRLTEGPLPEENEHQAFLWLRSLAHVEGVYRIRGLLRKYEGEFRLFDPEQWVGDPPDDGTEAWERGVTVSYAALNWWTQHQLRPVFGSQPLAPPEDAMWHRAESTIVIPQTDWLHYYGRDVYVACFSELCLTFCHTMTAQ